MPPEIERLGGEPPDVILVSGDAYIDSPFSGVALIGRVLASAGFRVALIPQPSIASRRSAPLNCSSFIA